MLYCWVVRGKAGKPGCTWIPRAGRPAPKAQSSCQCPGGSRPVLKVSEGVVTIGSSHSPLRGTAMYTRSSLLQHSDPTHSNRGESRQRHKVLEVTELTTHLCSAFKLRRAQSVLRPQTQNLIWWLKYTPTTLRCLLCGHHMPGPIEVPRIRLQLDDYTPWIPFEEVGGGLFSLLETQQSLTSFPLAHHRTLHKTQLPRPVQDRQQRLQALPRAGLSWLGWAGRAFGVLPCS